jgi:hypothetical protein
VRPDPTDLVDVERSCRTSGLVGTLPSSSNIVESVVSRDGGFARFWRGRVGEGARAVECKGGAGFGHVCSPSWREEAVLRLVIREE